MADATHESVILEHLRHIRGKVDRLSDDMVEVKRRLSNIEIAQGHLQSQMGQLNQRMDGIDVRVDRIEQRLDMVEAPKPVAE